MANFQETYVKIAEATAASRDALDGTVAPLGDTTDYDALGSDGNVRVVVDTVTDDFTEPTISGVQFEIDNLIPANSTWTQMRDLSLSNTPYNGLVVALNDFVTNYVLGEVTTNPSSVDGLYQTTLQGFIDIDCSWSDPSIGAPLSWVELSAGAGFDVEDTKIG